MTDALRLIWAMIGLFCVWIVSAAAVGFSIGAMIAFGELCYRTVLGFFA
jgi:hypothetical protein